MKLRILGWVLKLQGKGLQNNGMILVEMIPCFYIVRLVNLMLVKVMDNGTLVNHLMILMMTENGMILLNRRSLLVMFKPFMSSLGWLLMLEFELML